LTGDFESAVTAEETTEKLRPGDRTLHICMMSKAIATYEMDDFDTAEDICRKSLMINDQYWLSNLILAATLGQKEKSNEARVVGEKVVRFLPDLSEEGLLKFLPFRERGHLDRIVDGLRKAQIELG
jgi:hypothetical protein